MKVAPKVIFLFKDPDGLGPAIFAALQPNPNSLVRRTETSFGLSLEKYGIKDCQASGELVHFIDHQGLFQVSVLLMQNYEPPVVVCAINEVLASLVGENSSTMPAVMLPFVAQASRLNWEMTITNDEVALYGTHMGPASDFTQAMLAAIKNPPPSLQIHYEPLACLLQLARILKLPTVLLIGPMRHSRSEQNREEELKLVHKMGELLASNVDLCFNKERIGWNPIEKIRAPQEPWRELYG